MTCPICGYRTPDARDSCRRCGAPLRAMFEKSLGTGAPEPQPADVLDLDESQIDGQPDGPFGPTPDDERRAAPPAGPPDAPASTPPRPSPAPDTSSTGEALRARALRAGDRDPRHTPVRAAAEPAAAESVPTEREPAAGERGMGERAGSGEHPTAPGRPPTGHPAEPPVAPPPVHTPPPTPPPVIPPPVAPPPEPRDPAARPLPPWATAPDPLPLEPERRPGGPPPLSLTPPLGQAPPLTPTADAFAAPDRESAAALVPGARDYAGFWVRFFALLSDLTILGAVWLLLVLGAIGIAGDEEIYRADSQAMGNPVAAVVSLFWCLIVVFYFAYFTCVAGATPGKAALRLRVVRAGGGPVGFGRALVRFLGYFLELFPGAVLMRVAVSAGFVLPDLVVTFASGTIAALVLVLGYFWAAFDPRKQAWHDKMAGTVVVRLG